jgi:hypothetical protein
MIIYIVQNIEDWIFQRCGFNSQLVELQHRQSVARYILDNRPKGLERGQDWLEYLESCNLERISLYFQGKIDAV